MGTTCGMTGIVNKPPVVLCPGCKKAMRPGKPKPLAKDGMAEIGYVCETCGAATRRILKADDIRPKARSK